MQTLEELFKFILEQERSLVFGNLSRYPQLIYESLVSIPSLQVLILSNHCPLTSKESRIRVQRSSDPIDRCDLLIYIEPAASQLITKHALASRVVVFASHFAFQKPDNERWVPVSYFHGVDPTATQELLSIQDFPLQTRNVGLVEVDREHVLALSGRIPNAPRHADTYVIVNLTPFHKDALSMYLAFWDAFDYLLEHRAFVNRWVCCFSDQNRPGFLRFTQKVIDALFCRTFEHGNVTETRQILLLLPFFQSGTIDRTFDLNVSVFGQMKFVAPKTVEDACKAAAMHNVVPVAKNVLWIPY